MQKRLSGGLSGGEPAQRAEFDPQDFKNKKYQEKPFSINKKILTVSTR
jgi:hypothetical protein